MDTKETVAFISDADLEEVCERLKEGGRLRVHTSLEYTKYSAGKRGATSYSGYASSPSASSVSANAVIPAIMK